MEGRIRLLPGCFLDARQPVDEVLQGILVRHFQVDAERIVPLDPLGVEQAVDPYLEERTGEMGEVLYISLAPEREDGRFRDRPGKQQFPDRGAVEIKRLSCYNML